MENPNVFSVEVTVMLRAENFTRSEMRLTEVQQVELKSISDAAVLLSALALALRGAIPKGAR